MIWTGNLRKMSTSLNGKANYRLRLFDGLESQHEIEINRFVGHKVCLKFENEINCVVTGKKIPKTFGEGMSFSAFMKSPSAVESIIRPELSRIHEGIALRDFDWENEHHNTPHYVYLSRTSGVKVGVTREINVPFRWIDQGAIQAILLAETPYRQLAGQIEVSLKEHLSDKTNWRDMLTNKVNLEPDLLTVKEEVLELLDEGFYEFISEDDDITTIEYPVLSYPEKVKSLKLDTTPIIEGVLQGIKGQYLIFDGGRVINIRSHAGYKVSFETDLQED